MSLHWQGFKTYADIFHGDEELQCHVSTIDMIKLEMHRNENSGPKTEQKILKAFGRTAKLKPLCNNNYFMK